MVEGLSEGYRIDRRGPAERKVLPVKNGLKFAIFGLGRAGFGNSEFGRCRGHKGDLTRLYAFWRIDHLGCARSLHAPRDGDRLALSHRDLQIRPYVAGRRRRDLGPDQHKDFADRKCVIAAVGLFLFLFVLEVILRQIV